jgi:hypothetical protein
MNFNFNCIKNRSCNFDCCFAFPASIFLLKIIIKRIAFLTNKLCNRSAVNNYDFAVHKAVAVAGQKSGKFGEFDGFSGSAF